MHRSNEKQLLFTIYDFYNNTYIQEVVKALIEEAKEYSGDTKCALKVFFKAINVCMKYHLHDESTLILKNDIFCKSILYAIEQGLPMNYSLYIVTFTYSPCYYIFRR